MSRLAKRSRSVSAPEVDENAADAFEDELAALTDDVEIGEEVSASVSAPVGDVGDSDVAIEAVDIQEAVEPIGEAATETVEDAVDLMASESSEEIDAFEDEVSALTDDVEIGEEVSESVSASEVDENAADAFEDSVDLMAEVGSEEIDAFEDEVSALTDDVEIGEEVSESVSASEVDENAADAFEDSVDLMAEVGSDEEHVIQDDTFAMGTDDNEVGVLLDDEMSIGAIDLDALENLSSMDSVEDSREETSVFKHDEGQFNGIEEAGVDNGQVPESLDTKGETVDSKDIDLDALESQIALETVNQNADETADILSMLDEDDSEERSRANGDVRELSQSRASSVQVRGLEGVNRESLAAGASEEKQELGSMTTVENIEQGDESHKPPLMDGAEEDFSDRPMSGGSGVTDSVAHEEKHNLVHDTHGDDDTLLGHRDRIDAQHYVDSGLELDESLTSSAFVSSPSDELDVHQPDSLNLEQGSMIQDDLMISGTESLQYERENFTDRERGTSSSENTGENKFSHTVMIEELLASEEARLDHDFIDEIREFRYEPIADAFERSLREAQHRLVPSDPATERAVLDTLTQEISGGIDPWDIDLLDINQPTSTRSDNADKESNTSPILFEDEPEDLHNIGGHDLLHEPSIFINSVVHRGERFTIQTVDLAPRKRSWSILVASSTGDVWTLTRPYQLQGIGNDVESQHIDMEGAHQQVLEEVSTYVQAHGRNCLKKFELKKSELNR